MNAADGGAWPMLKFAMQQADRDILMQLVLARLTRKINGITYLVVHA